MYIATNEMQLNNRGLIDIFPVSIRKLIYGIDFTDAEEIKIICGKPVMISFGDGVYYINKKGRITNNVIGTVCISYKDILEILERITKSSLYSVKDEIKNGYITIEGGHRVGLTGTAVTEDNTVKFIRDISALNIRIANEIIGAADGIMDAVMHKGQVHSTLVISPPGAGKTTMLRDVSRQLSQLGFNISIADERCEIAAMYDGKSIFDLGNRTTVMDNCPKDKSMLMLLRSMSPDVIITDEIGTKSDAESIRSIINSGVEVITTVHGKNKEQIRKRSDIESLLRLFECIVTLSKRNGVGTIEEILIND